MSSSAFAGSCLLISPELLFEADLVTKSNLANHPDFSPYLTDYRQVEAFKKKLLQDAFTRFHPDRFPGYTDFLAANYWLDDDAIFMTAKEAYNNAGWFFWPKELATRSKAGLEKFFNHHTERD